MFDVERLILQTPRGGEIPLGQAAMIDRGRAYTQISRVDQRRIVRVTADVEDGTNASEVVASIEKEHLPGLLADFPGLRYRLTGDEKNRAEALGALGRGMILALIAMFGLLAIAFRSYAQPIIVMSAIPFGMIGAVLGHILMGYELSLMSMMGIVALSGVVVNDSLILVDAANRYRGEGQGYLQSIISAGQRRFRPILLTSLTTFFGLAPMIVETSVQARFLIPMALSLGFGVLFATFIILLLVPALYMIVHDLGTRGLKAWRFVYGPIDQPVGGE
jgi:multidrug efflux pump subunit AcrB